MTHELEPPPKNEAPFLCDITGQIMSAMLALALFFSMTSIASCSVDARVTLNPGRIGVEADVALRPEARVAWGNLQQLDATLPADPLDPTLLKSGLGPGASVAADPKGTHLKFSFDPQKYLPDVNDASGWEITLDRAAVRRLAGLTSWGNSPALDALVPAPDTKVTDADYRDLLAYLLGSDTGNAAIDASTVTLTITAPRPVKSAPGAEISGNTATYRWPLVTILAMEKPIKIKLVY